MKRARPQASADGRAAPRKPARHAARHGTQHGTRHGTFVPPLTVSHPAMLASGSDVAFRETLYAMVLAFGRLIACREAFGRALALTGSQFAVLIGAAYQQGRDGVSINALAAHIQLASTHVTTEVGRLARKGLLAKRVNRRDRRGVLVTLTPAGEAAVREISPFLRRVNDQLFADVRRSELAAVSRFLRVFLRNGGNALAEIRRREGRG